MVDRSQLMRGTLEGCIVKIISEEETYGYEIVSRLREYGFKEAGGNSIYSILLRLGKKSMLKVNSYDAQVIRRDLIGMPYEMKLGNSSLQETIGDERVY